MDEELLRFICRLILRSCEEMFNQSIRNIESLMAANEKRYKKIETKEIVRENKRLNNVYYPRKDSIYLVKYI